MYTSVRNSPATARGPVADGRRAAGRVGGTVVAMGMVSLLTDAATEMVTAVLPLFLVLSVGLTPLQYGAVDGLYQGATVAVRVLGGWLADRWRRPKAVCTVGYGLSAAMRLGLPAVGSAGSISALLAADRAGKGLRTAPRDAIIAASVGRAVLGRAFGVHRTLDTAGAMLGPLLAFAVLAAAPGSYDSVFVTSFCIAVVGVAVLVLLVPDVRLGGPVRRPVRAPVGVRPLLPVLAAAGLLGLVTVSDGFVYLTLADRLATPFEVFPLFLFAASAVYLVLALPVGRLADRCGRVPVLLAGHAGLLGLYALLVLPGPAWLACAGCLTLLGAYYAATDGVLAALVAGLVPAERRGTGLALAQTAQATGRLLSSLLFGLLWTVLHGQRTALTGFGVALALALPVAARLLRAGTREARADA